MHFHHDTVGNFERLNELIFWIGSADTDESVTVSSNMQNLYHIVSLRDVIFSS